MKNKYIISILLTTILVLTLLPLTSAWFTRDHTRFTLQGFDTINSPTTDMCRPYINVVLDGNMGNDLGVLHYVGDKVTSYIFPHTKSGIEKGDVFASTDDSLKCQNLGAKLHDVQDYLSHGEGGYTAKYLRKFAGNNYIWHMVVEKSAEQKNDKLYAETNPNLQNRVEAYDTVALNSLFPELGGDAKHMELINLVAGMDMSNDAKIFRDAYTESSSFFNTVYQNKAKVPFIFIVIPIGIMLIGLLIIVLLFLFGKTGWKWAGIVLGIFLLLIGIVLLFTMLIGKVWTLVSFLITIPPKFGYMQISDSDLQYYDQITQEATNQLLLTGEFNIQDASGLSYVDQQGVFVEGALTNASKGSNYVTVLFILWTFVMLINIFYKSLVLKKSRGKINKILNWSFLILTAMIILLLIYFLIRAFIF